jgi:hypothetical protein
LVLVHQPGERYERTLRINAVLFDNGRMPEGDPAAIEYIRYARLGKLAESIRILALLKKIDHSSPDDASIDALTATAGEKAKSPDAVFIRLAQSTPATGNTVRLEKLLARAGENASRAFLSGSGFRRLEFRDMMEKLKALPTFEAEAGKDRASYLSTQEAELQRDTAALQRVVDRDLDANR